MRIRPRFWSGRPGLVAAAALLGLATSAPAAGDEPNPPTVPDFGRIQEDLRQVAELRRRALAAWKEGRPDDAIAAAETLLALGPRLGEDGIALGKYLKRRREFSAHRVSGMFGPQIGLIEGIRRDHERREENQFQALSVHESTVRELVAALSEAQGDLAAAGRAWEEVARLKSDRLGSGHWLVDEARRESERLERLAALPAARRRLIEQAKGATAVLAVGVPDMDVAEIHTSSMGVRSKSARRDLSQQLGSSFCVDPRGYFVAGAGAVTQGKRSRRTTSLERERGTLTRASTTFDQAAWGPMSIVYRAGRVDARDLPARVIWVDEDSGLAVLKVRSAEPLPFLELARRETGKGDWACPLGYPSVPREQNSSLGVSIPGEPLSIPVLRADPTCIGSFHLQKGRPWLIILDSAVPQVNSGGLTGAPVLNDEGRVLGVLIEGLSGTDTHYVIPAARLAELLDRYRGRAEVLFDTPPLVFRERKAPVDWTFEVARLEPLPAGAVVEVIINSVSARRRSFVASPRGGGLFTARVVPVDPGDPDPVDVLVAGSAEPVRVLDREVSVGGERVPLRDLRWIEMEPSPHGYTADGRPFTCKITGLGRLDGRRGQEAVTINPVDAGSLTLDYPPRRVEPIPIEIVVREGSQVLGRLDATAAFREPRIPLCDPGAAERAGPRWAGPAIGPATTAMGLARIVATPEIPTKFAPSSPVAGRDGPLVRRLDGTIDGLAVGGGGRYLLLKLKDRRRIAIFDATTADLVASLPLASDDALIAAGAAKAIVVYPSLSFVHRFDLASMQLDATAAVPFPGRIDGISMGCDSAGPLLATWTPANVTEELGPRWFSLIDSESLKVIPSDSVRSDPPPIGPVQPELGVIHIGSFEDRRDQLAMRASAGGDLFALWRASGSPSGVQTLELRGRTAELKYLHDDAGALAPGSDGHTIFTERGGRRDTSGKAPNGTNGSPEPEAYVPAIGSPFFLGIRGLTPANGPSQAKPAVAMIHLSPKGEAPLGILNLDEMQGQATGNPPAAGRLTPDQRFLWLPSADLLITIPATRDRLVLRRLDLRGALERSGIDGLFPASPGLLTVTSGRPLHARIRVISRDEKTTLALARGPEGLTIAPDGTIAWQPPARLAGQEVPVNVIASDRSGRRLEFTLQIRVR